MGLVDNLNKIQSKLLDVKVKIVAVSKTQPIDNIIELYNSGQRDFGENKVQELAAKYEELKDFQIDWHMIGHLQRNKVKYIAPFVSMIHSVDSFKLLVEINKQAAKNNRIIDCLIQFYIADEESKFGFNIDECYEMLNSEEYRNLKNVNIRGVMGMASFTDDMHIVREEFKNLKNYFDLLKNDFFSANESFSEISMGMTNDWEVAVEEKSNILRIGSLIFGERNYN